MLSCDSSCYIMEQMEAQVSLTFCLDSKTINTLTDCPIKSIVGQTTSECGGEGGGGQQQQQL